MYMRKTYFIVIIIFNLLIYGCTEDKTTNPDEYGTVSGHVSDAFTGEFLSYVSINISDTYYTETDTSGFYSVNNIPAGNYYIKTMKPDYYSDSVNISIIAGKNHLLDFNLNRSHVGGIPVDPQDIIVPQTQHNNILPTVSFEKTSGNVIKTYISGINNPVSQKPIELCADYVNENYNFYLEEDGTLKGVKLTEFINNSLIKIDLVFLIDVSISMGEEADSIATHISSFADQLYNSGLDVQYGVIGYYGNIRGAINLSSAIEINNYLNRPNNTSILRAQGFAGPDSADLENAAASFATNLNINNENGIVGIVFADSLFNWRTGAQRIFINFTDEPIFPNGLYQWSTDYICSEFTGQYKIHTFFSEDTINSWQTLQREKPWRLSDCTGGYSDFISPDASDLDLTSIPLSGAISSYYTAEFRSSNPSSLHSIKITIIDSLADGKLEYNNIWYSK